MKWQLKATLVGLSLVVAAVASAGGDDRQCSVIFNTSNDGGNTAAPASGNCNWTAGSTLLMQCSTPVYFSASGDAGSTDFVADFTNNPDPYIICLSANQTNVSVLGVSADGGCKFSKTNRRVPCK